MRTPKPTKADLARSRGRAHAIGSALGLVPRSDPEFPTHWHVEGEYGGRKVHITIGCPRFARGLFRSACIDFMVVRIEGPTWLPEGAEARPARRTVGDWREGAPGEAGNVATAAGASYVLLPAELVPALGQRVADAVDRLPHAGWVHATSTDLELRPADLEEGDDAAQIAKAVLDWDGFRASEEPACP